jgi:hypothetical protein
VGREKLLLVVDCGDEFSAGDGGGGGVGGMSSGGGDGMTVGGPSIEPKKFMVVHNRVGHPKLRRFFELRKYLRSAQRKSEVLISEGELC